MLRLQKIMADAGIASRREAERLIADGMVVVNGKKAILGQKADPTKDHIKIDGKRLNLNTNVKETVIAIHKPRDVLCLPFNHADRNTHENLFHLIPKIKIPLNPASKLDRDAEGLVLLSNHSELNKRLSQRKYETPRSYRVKIDGHLDDKKIKSLSRGLLIEGKRVKPLAYNCSKKLSGKSWHEVTLVEPANRLPRKIFEFLGYAVDKVIRTSLGEITLKGLPRGQFRYLTNNEIVELKTWLGIKN